MELGCFSCNLCFIPDKYLLLIWESVIRAAGEEMLMEMNLG